MQSESCALMEGVELCETFKYLSMFSFGYSHSSVGHRQSHLSFSIVVLALEGDAPLFCIFYCVSQEVDKNLQHPMGICAYHEVIINVGIENKRHVGVGLVSHCI